MLAILWKCLQRDVLLGFSKKINVFMNLFSSWSTCKGRFSHGTYSFVWFHYSLADGQLFRGRCPERAPEKNVHQDWRYFATNCVYYAVPFTATWQSKPVFVTLCIWNVTAGAAAVFLILFSENAKLLINYPLITTLFSHSFSSYGYHIMTTTSPTVQLCCARQWHSSNPTTNHQLFKGIL